MLKRFHKKNILKNVFCFLIVSLICVVEICAGANARAMGIYDKEEVPNLYRFNWEQFPKLLTEVGCPDFRISDVQQNSDGTTLRFFDMNKEKVIVISCNGDLKVINYPPGAYDLWIDDRNQIVAWFQGNSIYYQDGSTDPPPFFSGGIDPGGSYFTKSVGAGAARKLSIYSVKHPHIRLADVDAGGTGLLRLFVRGDKLFVFDLARDGSYNVWTFQITAEKLVKLSEVTIVKKMPSAPFYAVNVSLDGNVVLIEEVFDVPSKSKWHLFDLTTCEMKKIGKAAHRGFFLQCDILKVFGAN